MTIELILTCVSGVSITQEGNRLFLNRHDVERRRANGAVSRSVLNTRSSAEMGLSEKLAIHFFLGYSDCHLKMIELSRKHSRTMSTTTTLT